MRLSCACMASAGIVAVAASACGGDGEEPSGANQPLPSESLAREPAQTFATRLAKLLETSTTKRDCGRLEAIGDRSAIEFPCPPGEGLRRSMTQFEVVGTEEYGTGAVVDYASGGSEDGAAMVLSIGAGRTWAVNRFAIITEPSTGTSDETSRAGFREAVDSYLTAVRERDCKAFAAVAVTVGVSSNRVCETAFRATRTLARSLRAEPAARPEYQGGNGTYGFFTLELRKPRPGRVTISAIRDRAKPSDDYLVLDVAPSPTVAQQREAIEAIERQLRKRGEEPETSPSRKADG